MRDLIAKALPRSWKQRARKVWFRGRSRYCPVCKGSVRSFLPSGTPPRPDARCPVCDCVERHRLAWLFFERKTNLFDGRPKRMLHFAAELELASRLRRVAGLTYITADALDARAMVKMDITRIPYSDRSFDAIFCSHVLEHVPDDRAAMSELHRILTPEGWAALEIPITAPATIEDPSITDPAERERLFGQRDHVRRYGPDFEDRLREAGFLVQCFTAQQLVGDEEATRFGLREEIFFCAKRIEPSREAPCPARRIG
jgi:SAM-dependent methyltransferase